MSGVTLLTSLRERRVSETMVQISTAGEPDAAALVNAVAGRWPELLGRESPTVERVQQLAAEKAKVTLVRTGETMFGASMIVGQEGTLFEGQGGIGLLPKGKRTRGVRVDVGATLDLLDGWQIGEAQRLVDEARDRFPKLRPLTQERLAELPSAAERAELCTLAVFGTHPGFPGTGRCVDALWLIGSYDAEDDIVDDSVLLIRPDVGVSEHGSSYGRDLLRLQVGEVVGFEPIPFSEAVRLCDVDHDEGLAAVFGRQLVTVEGGDA